MNRWIFGIVLSLFLSGFGACSTSSPRYEVAVLQGNWLRIESTDTRSDSMIVTVQNDSAIIVSVPDSSNFEVVQL